MDNVKPFQELADEVKKTWSTDTYMLYTSASKAFSQDAEMVRHSDSLPDN